MEQDGIPTTPESAAMAAEVGHMVAVVSEAEREEALRSAKDGPFRHDGQEYSAEVVETSPDTGETVKHTLQPQPQPQPQQQQQQQPDEKPAADVTPLVAHDLRADERPESIPASEQPSPSEAPSSPAAPTVESPAESSPGPAWPSPPPVDESPAEVEVAAVAATASASLAASPAPGYASSGGSSSSSSSIINVGGRPHARKHGHHRHRHHRQRAGQAAGDGPHKRVLIDEAAVGHEKGKGSAKHRRRTRRRGRPPAPSVADVLVILCGFVITLVVLTGLAASTRHLFKQKSQLVVNLHRINQQGRLNADSFAPPTLVCGVSRLSGMAELSGICSHIIYTGDMDIFSDGVEYTLLPADAANFEAFRKLGSPGSLVPQLLASVPLAPLWERLPDHVRWHRFGRSMARLINNASLHGIEVRLSPSLALNEDILYRLQVSCQEFKMSDPDAIMFLRLRYDALLATNNNMEKLVDCPDLVVFRTENHELSTRVLRAPNPYRRYIGADMAELFLQQELDKISLLRKPVDGQEWCLSFALGGLLFRYHLGLSFGDDAQTGPQEISLSEVCERFSVRRFEDLRTLSFYAMEHTKHTWVAFDDDWSLTRKALLARQRQGPRMCVAVYHVELDDHRQSCGNGPAPVLRRLQRLIVNGTT
ncbi:uncharacterized protein [Dermacentor albipictus]|uniref:uncharacterized protein n=1 Tax=Dermacentor albipictus TaxID=60249 RepID=UPI0031FD2D4B